MRMNACGLVSILILLVLSGTAADAGPPEVVEPWKYPLEYRGKLDSPLVEVTPFVFRDRLYRLDNWQKQWEYPGTEHNTRFTEDEVRIRDMATDEIVSTPLVGHGLGMAFVHAGRVYVFAGNWGSRKKWEITEIQMVSSADLVTWTAPQVVLRANADEKFFNVSVCRGKDSFVLLVESNDPRWPAFTFKYFRSDDLVKWEPVPDAYYGIEKYVGGPALYYEGGFYYTLYLQSLGDRFYETRVTRSKDLVHWQDAPDDRPVATFNPENAVHALRPPEIREKNASDAELCYWQGKTIVYYTGGDQHLAGDLQLAEYDGTPRELLEHFYSEPAVVVPNARQIRYHDNQVGCFVHFGPASYIGGDDYLATPPAEVFDPRELDTAQWTGAAKSVGARHIILTAKHHNGFCLWPTDTTEYSVRGIPWKNGEGDLVREFVDAARAGGIAPGLYISAGDTKFGCYATPEPRGVRSVVGDVDAYFPVFMQQLRELLTDYGELEVVWFDGAYNPFDPDVLDHTGKPMGETYAGPVTDMVRELQPNAVIMGMAKPDVRWSGSEQGLAPYPLWYTVNSGEGRSHWLPDDATGWFVPEANVHTRRHWFWSPDSDGTLRTPAELMSMFHASAGHGANLLINLTPDMSGKIPAAEISMLEGFGRALGESYAEPIAEIENPPWSEGHTIYQSFDAPVTIERLVMEEDIRYGQRILSYRIESLNGDRWSMIAEGESVGRRRIESFAPVTTDALRIRIVENLGLPRIRYIGAFGSR